MSNQQTTTRTTNAQGAKTKIKRVIERIADSFVYKIAVVSAVVVTGLMALGGLYRVLAWTMQGWNQLCATFKK